MGGSFSAETQEWELASDLELRKRFVRAVQGLFPASQSFAILDDELSFSLLDVEGRGLVNEAALHQLVKRCGFKMERWQLLYLLDRLDSDGDGFVGFADFILFMHGQDPKVAQKRGIRGPRAVNVALSNAHLQGPSAKAAPVDQERSGGGVGDNGEGSGGNAKLQPGHTINTARVATPTKMRKGNILFFNDESPQQSGSGAAAHAHNLASPPPSAGASAANKELNGAGRGTARFGKGNKKPLLDSLSAHEKRYLRRFRGHFAPFDEFRSTRMPGAMPGTVEDGGNLGQGRGGETAASPGGSKKVGGSGGPVNGLRVTGGGKGPGFASSAGSRTLNGLKVPSATHDYCADTVRSQALELEVDASWVAKARMFEYLSDHVYGAQDDRRAQRVHRTACENEAMNEVGRKVVGRAVVWRTDAGGGQGEGVHQDDELNGGSGVQWDQTKGVGLVPTGPRYWDPSREHLHIEAFSPQPPSLGKPGRSSGLDPSASLPGVPSSPSLSSSFSWERVCSGTGGWSGRGSGGTVVDNDILTPSTTPLPRQQQQQQQQQHFSDFLSSPINGGGVVGINAVNSPSLSSSSSFSFSAVRGQLPNSGNTASRPGTSPGFAGSRVVSREQQRPATAEASSSSSPLIRSNKSHDNGNRNGGGSRDAQVMWRRQHQVAVSTAPKSGVFADKAPPHLRGGKSVHDERRGASRPLMPHHHQHN